MSKFRDAFSGFGAELIESIRENCAARLDEAAFEERILGIERTTAALLDAKVKEDKIISLLQNYWDLRKSEANEFIEIEKEKRLDKKE